MDFTFAAMASVPDSANKWFLLAACMVLCIYSTVYLINFKDKLVTESNYKFLLYILTVAIVDATFIFLCWDRLTFDEMCGMFICAPIVYLITSVLKRINK